MPGADLVDRGHSPVLRPSLPFVRPRGYLLVHLVVAIHAERAHISIWGIQILEA